MRRVVRRACSAALLTALVLGAADARAQSGDYDAPDPNRSALTHLRAFANLTFTSSVIWTIDYIRGPDWVFVTRNSIASNATSFFELDYDPLQEDMLGHPLHGMLHFESARAAGLSFWESAIYPFVGSLEWEILGERQESYGNWRSKPSTNDFLTTSTGGVLLGEAVHRISSELLDDSTSGVERLFREIGAALVSPERGFNRLYTGAAWKAGDPPAFRMPFRFALELGVDRVRRITGEPRDIFDPTPFAAAEIEYGDLLPRNGRDTIEPFEYFDGYLAFNFFDDRLSGAQVYGDGLLYGWSTPISEDKGELADNNVFGFIDSFDYQGANVHQFGALSIGPGNYTEWRFGPNSRFRVGASVGWSYLAATTSPYAVYDHVFSMGADAQLMALGELGRAGEIQLHANQFLTATVDGQSQEEAVGYTRMSYRVDLLPHLGVGTASTLIHRYSQSHGQSAARSSLETQLYLVLHI